jgi:hypothetical protein
MEQAARSRSLAFELHDFDSDPVFRAFYSEWVRDQHFGRVDNALGMLSKFFRRHELVYPLTTNILNKAAEKLGAPDYLFAPLMLDQGALQWARSKGINYGVLYPWVSSCFLFVPFQVF